jgi:hypothetical protein
MGAFYGRINFGTLGVHTANSTAIARFRRGARQPATWHRKELERKMKQKISRLIPLCVLPFALTIGLAAVSLWSAETKTAADNPYCNYDDFRQFPIRVADLVKMMEEAELITAVRFDLKKITPAPDGPTLWKAQVVRGPAPGAHWEFRHSEFKGKWGKDLGNEITLKGDLKAFALSEEPLLDVKKGFGFVPGNEFIVFLKPTEEEGIYQCLELNPGGFCQYVALGARVTDHRKLYVGRVNGKLVVEGGPGYKNSRMCGPTNLADALRNLRTGAKLTAKAVDGAAVELELKIGGANVGPPEFVMAAPVLWAEIEGEENDAVLLSAQDYKLPEKVLERVEAKNIAGGVLTGCVELPTGAVPEGADLTWALGNHRKPLAGSLGKGVHTVRFFCHVTENDLAISNPITVQGVEGAAGPDQIAALLKMLKPATATQAEPAAVKVEGEKSSFDKAQLQGFIFFDSNRDGNWDIFVMNADGSDVRNLTNTPDKDEFEAKSSPDGKHIAYVSGKLKNGGVWGGRWNAGDLWVADIDGKNPRKIAEKASRPDWSPDGKAVFYSGTHDGKGAYLAQEVETGKIMEPLKKAEKFMRGITGGMLAPGKLKVAFGGKLWTQTNAALYVADLDEKYEFTKFKAVNTQYHGCTPRWSATGDFLYFAHHDPQHKGEIILWTIKSDGTGAKRFETPARKAWPGYDPFCEAPDGKTFVFLEWGGSGVNVMRFADGASAKLLEKKDKVAYGGLWWHRGEAIK